MQGQLSELRNKDRLENTNLSWRDIIFTLYRRRWIALAVAVPIIVMGALSLFQQTGAFTAHSRILVDLEKVDLPKWNTVNRNINYDRELSTLLNLIKSVSVVENAAESLTDSVSVILELAPEAIGFGGGNWLRDFLFGGLDASPVGESNILELRFSSINPRLSLMALEAIQEAFMEYQVFGRRNLNSIVYYQEQSQLVRSEMDSLLEIRTAVMQEYGISSLKDELRHDTGRLADLQDELSKTISGTKVLEVELFQLESALEKDPRLFPMGPEESRSLTLVSWRNIVSRHEDELNNLMAIHTEDSLPVRRQYGLLERALTSLRREELAYIESFKLSLTSSQEKEESIRNQIRQLQRENQELPVLYQQVSVLDAEINSLTHLMEDLQGKLGEVRISQLADERVSGVLALSVPEIQEVLSGGKTIVYLFMIILFALALGTVAAFLQEAMDHRIYSARDVEAHLNLPVFTTVTKVE